MMILKIGFRKTFEDALSQCQLTTSKKEKNNVSRPCQQQALAEGSCGHRGHVHDPLCLAKFPPLI